LRSLKNRKEIDAYRTTYLEKDIENLTATKNQTSETERKRKEQETQEAAKKEQERLKREQTKKEKKEETEKKVAVERAHREAKAKKTALKNQKINSITKIAIFLNQEPKLNNSDLSPEYQTWESKINQSTEIDQITEFEGKVLANIQARRKDKKTEQEVKESLNQFQNPESTPQQKEEALNNLSQNEGEPAHEANKEQINQAKTEQACSNPANYSQKALCRLENKMKQEGVSKADLNLKQNLTLQVQIEKLRNNQIKDPTQIVKTENQIIAGIIRIRVQKEIDDLTAEVNRTLQTLVKSKKQNIIKIKQKLNEFLAKSNIYYVDKRAEVQELSKRLEEFLQNTFPSSQPKKLPLPVKIIIGIGGVVLVIGFFTFVYSKKRKNYRSLKLKQK
jgi:hypothetical protein